MSVITDESGAVHVTVETDPDARCEIFWRDGLLGSGGWEHTGAVCTADPSGRAVFVDVGGAGRPAPSATLEPRFYIVAVEHDADGDALTDAHEQIVLGTDPGNPNCDADALTDGEEITDWHTDPWAWDTDGDGVCDGASAPSASTVRAEWEVPSALLAGVAQEIGVAFVDESGAPALGNGEVRIRLSGGARILGASGGAEILSIHPSGSEASMTLSPEGRCGLTVQDDVAEWALIGVLDAAGNRICCAQAFQIPCRAGPSPTPLPAGSPCLDFAGQDRVTISLPFSLPWFGRVLPGGSFVSVHGDGLIGLDVREWIDRDLVTLDFPQANDLPAMVLAGFGGSDPMAGPGACVRSRVEGGLGERTWTIEWQGLAPALNETLDLAYQVRFFENAPIVEIGYLSDDPVLADCLAGLRSATGDEGVCLDQVRIRRTGGVWALHPGWRRPVRFLDPEDDPDGDGLANELEATHLSQPFVADSDGDGLDDADETTLGTSPLVFDHDRDGIADGDEPVLVGATPDVISPNGDGVADTLTVTALVLNEADVLQIVVATAGGATVAQADVPGPEGRRMWIWQGTVDPGTPGDPSDDTPAPEGLYLWTATRIGETVPVGRGTVRVDLTAPEFVRFEMEAGGCNEVNTPNVQLAYRISEPGAVRFGHAPVDMGPWAAANEELVDWTLLDGPDGPRTVYAQAADDIGNTSEPVDLSIVLDTEAPTVTSFVINDGATSTRDRRIEIYLEAEGASDAGFRDPAQGSWSEWLSFESWTPGRFAWPLPEESWGLVTVEARVRDTAGNVSDTAAAEILYEPPPGGLGFVQASFSAQAGVVHRDPSWSPDASSLVYASSGFGSWDAMESYLAAGMIVTGYALLSETQDADELQVLRTGWDPHTIAASIAGEDGRNRLYLIPFDDFALPTPAATGVDAPQRDPVRGRHSGEILFLAGAGAATRLYALDAASTAVLVRSMPGARYPSVDPAGGNRILYTAADGVHLATIDGTSIPTPSGPSVDCLMLAGATCPTFSIDGTRYAASLHGDIVIVDADPMNVGEPVPITRTADNSQPVWSPDDEHVAFVSARSGAPRIWIRRLPDPRIEIDAGADVATSRDVVLTLDCVGAVELELWNEDDSVATESPFISETEWTLTGDEGLNEVHATFGDSDGIEWEASDTIVLDLPPRITSVWIGDGSGFTPTRDVDVHIEAVGADEVRVRNEGAVWGPWMPATDMIPHLLPDFGYGYYNVEVQCRDLDEDLPVQTIQESAIATAHAHYSNPIRIADASATIVGEDARLGAMLLATETGLTIAAAEVFVGVPGIDGEGYAVAAVDGAFDEAEERVSALIPLGVAPGERTVLYLHVLDDQGRWGAFLDVIVYPELDDILERVRRTHDRIRTCDYDVDITTWDGNVPASSRTAHVFRRGPYHLRIDDTSRATSTIVVGNRTIVATRRDDGSWMGIPVAYGPETETGAADFAWTDPEWDIPALRTDHQVGFDPEAPQGEDGVYRMHATWNAPRGNPRHYDAVILEIDYGAGSVAYEEYDDGRGIVTTRTVETEWSEDAQERFPSLVESRKMFEGRTVVHITEEIHDVQINPHWSENPFDASNLVDP